MADDRHSFVGFSTSIIWCPCRRRFLTELRGGLGLFDTGIGPAIMSDTHQIKLSVRRAMCRASNVCVCVSRDPA